MVRPSIVTSAHQVYSWNSFQQLSLWVDKSDKVLENKVFIESIDIFVSYMYGVI